MRNEILPHQQEITCNSNDICDDELGGKCKLHLDLIW